MGLDMYLEKKTYVKNWGHMTAEQKHEITVKYGGKVHKTIKPEKIKYITEEVGYWRKANHIHKWFVDNVQDGEDDCKEYYVSRKDLEKLLNACTLVLNDIDKAEEILPTESGFFFGSTEYDECYVQDLKNTIEILKPLLEISGEDDDGEYYYHSSW